MDPPGRKLASGRDADIFEYGPGLVLRRTRAGRSVADEARIMAYLHDQGYPVPAVHDVSDDGRDLVMERVDGPTMVDHLARRPWEIRRQGRSLANLHRALHALPAPDFLGPAAVGAGESIVHMDLHPLNVLVSPHGPVVIDWTNAGRGDPVVDMGLAYVLMSAGTIPGGPLVRRALGLGRAQLLGSFLSGADRAAVTPHLRDIVAWKVQDPNMSPEEVESMWRVAGQANPGD